jgi:predicted dehydrogenase
VFGTGSSSNSELAACGVLDNATMYIKFEGGVTCNIMMSRGSTYGYDQRCEVYGDGGIASIRSGNESSLSVGNNDGFHQSPLHYSFPQCFREAFEAEIETFASVLLDGVEWPVSEKDCVLAQLIAQAAKESCRLGCAVVMQPIYTPNAISLRPIGKGSFAQHMLGLLSDLDSKKLMFTVLPPYSPSSGLDYDSDVLKHTSVEAVYICSPDSMHHSQAVDCLRAGKHVLVEKPVYNFSGLMCAYNDMYQHASGAGIGGPRAPVFMVGFHRRFDQEFIRAKHACRVTMPTSLVVESRDPVPADSDLSFVIRNSVCHDVDLVHWLFAEYCECTVSFTKCSTDVSISGINLEGEIIIVLDDGDECKIDLKILYSKENKTYVQKCVLDGVIYGYDFAPAVEASNPYLIYQSAYEAQWKYFAGLIRDANNMKTEEDSRSRWESYNNSFNSLEQAELLMSQSLGA